MTKTALAKRASDREFALARHFSHSPGRAGDTEIHALQNIHTGTTVLLTVSSFLSVFFCAASFSTGSESYVNERGTKNRKWQCYYYKGKILTRAHKNILQIYKSPSISFESRNINISSMLSDLLISTCSSFGQTQICQHQVGCWRYMYCILNKA